MSFKVCRKVVDQCQPDAALPYIKFQVSLKDEKKLTDLDLTFKGIREKTTLVIGCYQLQQIHETASERH